MFFIRLFLANSRKKKIGVTVLVSSQTVVKDGHGLEIAVRMDKLRGGDWGEIQNSAFSKHALQIKLVFGCFYVFDIANTEIQT